MKKAIILIIIIALIAVVLLATSKTEKNSGISEEYFEESAEIQEMAQQSFRKTESSIPPPSADTEIAPTQEPSM